MRFCFHPAVNLRGRHAGHPSQRKVIFVGKKTRSGTRSLSLFRRHSSHRCGGYRRPVTRCWPIASRGLSLTPLTPWACSSTVPAGHASNRKEWEEETIFKTPKRGKEQVGREPLPP